MMNKRIITIIAFLTLAILIACGGKPGGLKDFNEIIPEFTERLNEAMNKATYNDLISLFDKNCLIIVNTEFNPEIYKTYQGARTYFSSIPLETRFTYGEIQIAGLRAETEYRFKQKNGLTGSGLWNFKFSNMGKISELTITPKEQKYQ